MEKVCVRIPNSKKPELLELDIKWRAEDTDLRPGWDSKGVHRIAKEKFGGLEGFL